MLELTVNIDTTNAVEWFSAGVVFILFPWSIGFAISVTKTGMGLIR